MEARTTRERPEVLIALIEHGSRPAAFLLVGLLVVVWLFAVREHFFDVFRNTESLKFGTFEVKLRASAVAANVGSELQALGTLNDEQLQLFLILGRRRGHISYEGEELTEENLRRLQEIGLIAEMKKLPNEKLWWRVSEQGHKLHEITRNLILSSIRLSATPKQAIP
jgi:hypothetical protein